MLTKVATFTSKFKLTAFQEEQPRPRKGKVDEYVKSLEAKLKTSEEEREVLKDKLSEVKKEKEALKVKNKELENEVLHV